VAIWPHFDIAVSGTLTNFSKASWAVHRAPPSDPLAWSISRSEPSAISGCAPGPALLPGAALLIPAWRPRERRIKARERVKRGGGVAVEVERTDQLTFRPSASTTAAQPGRLDTEPLGGGAELRHCSDARGAGAHRSERGRRSRQGRDRRVLVLSFSGTAVRPGDTLRSCGPAG